MRAQTLVEPTIRRLDHLPIIGQILRALRIREHVDARVEHDPRSHVSAGECVEALIVPILLGKHTLYRVDAPLSVEYFAGPSAGGLLRDVSAGGPLRLTCR